jgi:signal recognition particle GTPase
MKVAEGARYEISVDGAVRTHRDTREMALEAANVLKACRPHSKVVVRDLTTGETIEFAASDAMARKPS